MGNLLKTCLIKMLSRSQRLRLTTTTPTRINLWSTMRIRNRRTSPKKTTRKRRRTMLIRIKMLTY